MAGRIRTEDVEALKERVSIEEIVRAHVTLTRAGAGSLKGLCPFHDERTASFNVRPAYGSWHCFGCGEGGDVISFVQKVDHLDFVEAVERLAAQVGMELHYEDGGGRRDEGHGRRTRLVEANRVAEEYYHEALLRSPDARAARDFLRERGFDSGVAAFFQVGYAPRGGEDLVRHLRGKGFSAEEIVAAGLGGQGRGIYDRFRGRLVWPIRDITGDTVGFGARRLYDDDRIQAKYLNTAETAVYKKTAVLYGLDLAKKDIASQRHVVVVEGYTDVMACHLAGMPVAVATCGTAFGVEHIKTLRRLLRDDAAGPPARTTFTFDGDEAGQKAAMRAYEDDQRWASQSYVAVAADGQDPCELRIRSGDAAVRSLIDNAVPMFEFAVQTTLRRYDLDTAEGRVQAIRAVAPILSRIRDRARRPEYTRSVAGWIGVEIRQVADEVARAARRPPENGGDRGRRRESDPPDASAQTQTRYAAEEAGERAGEMRHPAPDLRDPAVLLERQLLQVLIQFPRQVPPADVELLEAEAFGAPVHRAIYDALRGAWPAADRSNAAWISAVESGCPPPVAPLIRELAVAPIHAVVDPDSGAPDPRYVLELVVRMREAGLQRRIVDATSTLRRLESTDPAAARKMSVDLVGLQMDQLRLRERLE